MQSPKWSAFDTRWILSLFGTAVGAGILYLPIKAGGGGIFPVIAMSVIIFPMVYLSHRALSLFVSQANGADKDITYAAEEYFGRNVSVFISVLYFFAIFPICLAYCVGITNTFESFVYHQVLPLINANATSDTSHSIAAFIQSIYTPAPLGKLNPADELNAINEAISAKHHKLLPLWRGIIVFILVSAFMLIMLFKQELITKICQWLVYPLCLILFAFSLYLIPFWNLSSFSQFPDIKEFLTIVWLTLPVLVFAFNHSPAISTFTLSLKQKYPHNFLQKADSILFKTALMLLFFVMFFVFSCVLSLDSVEFAEAREQNIPILSYFANKLNLPFISYIAPIVAFLAISTSFFGHYFGAREGAQGIVRKCCKILKIQNLDSKKINAICGITMYITMLLVGYYNPNILEFIENLGGPIIAAILFIMPIIALYSVSKMKKFQNKPLDLFVLISGIATIMTLLYSLLQT